MKMDTKPIGKDVQAAVKVLKALSNERRLMVVCALYSGEKSVGALEEMVGLSQSALSQHLARLRRDGIVKTRREAQTIYYSLDSSSTERILGCLYDLYCPQTRCFVQNQTGCGCHAPQTREVEGV